MSGAPPAPPEEVAFTLAHLARLTEAGVPAGEALGILARHAESRRLRRALIAAATEAPGRGAVAAAAAVASSPEFTRGLAEAARARGLPEAEVLRALAEHERRAPQGASARRG